MPWGLHLLKAFNTTLIILFGYVYCSYLNPEYSIQTLVMIISIFSILTFSLIHRIFEKQIYRCKFLIKILFFVEIQKTEEGKVLALTKIGLMLIGISGVASSTLISFSSQIMILSFIIALIPIMYLLRLIDFVSSSGTDEKNGSFFNVTFVHTLGLVIWGCLVLFLETEFSDTERVVKIIVVLTIFGCLLNGVLYNLVFSLRSNQILASFMNSVLYAILGFVVCFASRKGDFELMKISIFLAVALPFCLIASNVYFRCNISSELKNSVFLGIWTVLYVPLMSVVSKDYLEKNEKLFCNAVNFSFLSFGIYCMSFETLFRFKETLNRESKNTIFLMLIIFPAFFSVFFYSYNNLPSVILIILLIIILFSFITLLLLSIPILFILVFTSSLSPEDSDSILKYDDALTLIFSVLWKLVYMLGMCFMTRKVYFFEYHDKSSHHLIVIQGLLALISAMIHSVLLENINFFVFELDHTYPSVRKMSLVKQIIPSLLQESFEPKKKLWLKLVLAFMIISELASLALISASYILYFLIAFNLATGLLFILGFEAKFKTWDRGSKISSEFLIFIWTCIYIPCICGSSIISTSSIEGNIDKTSSLMIFFIIITFCVQLGLSSGEVYNKISSFKYVYMNLMLKEKGYSMNYRNLIIEDYQNKNLENFEIVEKGTESYGEYLKEHFLIVCQKCRQGEDHETPVLYYELNHNEFWRTLFLKPKLESFDLGEENDPEGEDAEEDQNGLVVRSKKLEINDEKLMMYRNVFRIASYERTVKKFHFVNYLASVYRKNIKEKKITRDDFFMIFLEITHNVSMRVILKFDKAFINKILRGIAKLLYNNTSTETLIRVDQEILNGKYREEINENENKDTSILGSFAAQASKIYLNLNITVKNKLDEFIPYSLIRLDSVIDTEKQFTIKEFFDELNKQNDDFTKDAIESINNSIQILFFASIFNMYSLSSVALNGEIAWLKSKLSLSTGIIPSEKSWIVSAILSFSLIFLFLLITLVLFLLIKYKKSSPRMIQWGKSLMVILASGLLVENIIFLLSNLICESTNGNLHILNNEDIECFSPAHIALLSISVVLFIIYFFLVQVFYPSFHKLSTKVENYLNVEMHCKVIYSTIASCLNNDLLAFKLSLCLFLVIILIIYSIYRIQQKTGNYEKFRSDLKEYLIVLWIYVWALLIYNEIAASQGFYVLIVTIFFYSAYAQRRCLIMLISLITKPCRKQRIFIAPQNDEGFKQSGEIDSKVLQPPNNSGFYFNEIESKVLQPPNNSGVFSNEIDRSYNNIEKKQNLEIAADTDLMFSDRNLLLLNAPGDPKLSTENFPKKKHKKKNHKKKPKNAFRDNDR